MNFIDFLFSKNKKRKKEESKKEKTESIRILLTEDTLTVIINNKFLSTTVDIYEKFKKLEKIKDLETNIDEILSILYSGEINTMLEEKNRELSDEYKDILLESGEIIKTATGYALSIYPKVDIPELLLYKIKEILDDIFVKNIEDKKYLNLKYNALLNFWKLCLLNPNPRSRSYLFEFLSNHDLKINCNGLFFAYRSVVKVKDNNDKYNRFVNDAYLQVSKKWKKKISNYSIYKNPKGDFFISVNGNKNSIFIDNLKNAYNSLSAETSYTDSYSKTFDIRIGQPVKMDRSLCDSNEKIECSRGLHIGNKTFSFSSFGDTKILCLINPMNVVSIPHNDCNKMRVCEYLPIAVLNEKDSNILEREEFLTVAEEYYKSTIESLKLDDLTVVDESDKIIKSLEKEINENGKNKEQRKKIII